MASIRSMFWRKSTAASWLVQDGVPLYDVQALLGHEDYATTQRYAVSQKLHQTGEGTADLRQLAA